MRVASTPYLSLATQTERLFWGLRGLIFLGVICQVSIGGSIIEWKEYGTYVTLGYLASLLIPYMTQRLLTLSFAAIFWPAFVFDVLFIGALSFLTGSGSNLFVLYYVMAAFVGYHMGLGSALGVAAAMSIVYAVPTLILHGLSVWPHYLFRGFSIWVFAGASSYAARSVQMSTERLLNAMDKLNERTTELERTHSQLETIYETSRSLGELMAEDSVIDRVLHIARSVLNLPVCEVYTWDRISRKLTLKGRVDETTTRRFDRPHPIDPDDVIRRAVDKGEVVRVVDRHLGRNVVDGVSYRSLLAVPMVSEGRVIGLLCAQSPNINAFSEHDEHVLSILSSSTALAFINADLHRKMEKLTIEDELTSVYNFRYFRSRLEDEKRRAVRYGQPLSLIMVDIDWFKQLNDRYGHEVGNVALRQLATVIGACIRDVDTLARYGGEEFIVILPQTATVEARTIGERIRRKVEESEFGPDSSGRPIRLTVSIGVSCYPDNGAPESNLVESVDQALYQAKGEGKNLVRLFES